MRAPVDCNKVLQCQWENDGSKIKESSPPALSVFPRIGRSPLPVMTWYAGV
jgi:hypothetical protein